MSSTTIAKPEPGPLLRLALDLGPLVVYFVGYALLKHVYPSAPGTAADPRVIYASTGLFMAATLVAMLFSFVRLGHVSPMQWFSAAMVLVLGGLTLAFQKPWFIQVKPTLYYLMVSGILWFGLWTGKPTLKLALGSAYPGLDARGWMLLSRNWAIFFIAMAVANEFVWRHFSFDFWIGYKLWGAIPATMIFAMANLPMLLKHGLGAETPAEVIADRPPVE
ncbi:inner membrane-spanning protein YciB [Sphingomonas abietis]|uniref:Inner membrane-spanning protein YciB n=1 Tax=Sphingomonas abietis TaxID=3012344 RepID=A0ABY7NNE2_9SPHN|nr:inner membrane-spanning protein YciB [Sphingomonas abietis]WBO21434.1 septation protein IspZ [Sphingomonas abietis]